MLLMELIALSSITMNAQKRHDKNTPPPDSNCHRDNKVFYWLLFIITLIDIFIVKFVWFIVLVHIHVWNRSFLLACIMNIKLLQWRWTENTFYEKVLCFCRKSLKWHVVKHKWFALASIHFATDIQHLSRIKVSEEIFHKYKTSANAISFGICDIYMYMFFSFFFVLFFWSFISPPQLTSVCKTIDASTLRKHISAIHKKELWKGLFSFYAVNGLWNMLCRVHKSF